MEHEGISPDAVAKVRGLESSISTARKRMSFTQAYMHMHTQRYTLGLQVDLLLSVMALQSRCIYSQHFMCQLLDTYNM